MCSLLMSTVYIGAHSLDCASDGLWQMHMVPSHPDGGTWNSSTALKLSKLRQLIFSLRRSLATIDLFTFLHFCPFYSVYS